MILGYTLTTFPKSLIQTKKQQKHNLHQIARSRRTLHDWWRISGQQVFYTARKQLNKIRKGGNLQPSKQQEKGQHLVLYTFLYLYLRLNQTQAGERL